MFNRQDLDVKQVSIPTGGDAFKEEKMGKKNDDQAEPVVGTPADQTVRTESIQSDDLNAAVANEAAANIDTVADEEPKAEVEETRSEEVKETADEPATEACPDEPADQTVRTESIQSDDLNAAVADETAEERETVTDGEPKERSGCQKTADNIDTVTEEVAAKHDTVSSDEEPKAEVEEISSEEAVEVSEESTAMEATPEEVEEVEATNTAEKSQEVFDAVVDVDWNEEIQEIMKNPTLRKITPLIKGELAKEGECQIRLCMLLDNGYSEVTNKSFRVWVTKVLDMEIKRAYELRAVGRFCSPLLKKKKVTLPYLYSVGISKLNVITRFPDTHWIADPEQGKIFIADNDNEFAPVDMLSVEKLRDILKSVKDITNEKHLALLMMLDDYDSRCTMLFEYQSEVEGKEEKLLPMIKAWDTDLETELKSKAETIEKLRESIKKVEMEVELLNVRRSRANWWIDMLQGNGDGIPAGCLENAAIQQEEQANKERLLAAQARTEKSRSRRK